MTQEDLELMEKFSKIIGLNPTEEEALKFWSELSAEEYDRLIFLFQQNKLEGMDDQVRAQLVEIFKKLRDKISEAGS